MADGSEQPRDDDRVGRTPQAPGEPAEEKAPQAVFRMELRDSLPGDRAVIGLERDGEFMWVGSRRHMDDQARDEFVDQLTRIVEDGWWRQNWPGVR